MCNDKIRVIPECPVGKVIDYIERVSEVVHGVNISLKNVKETRAG